MTCLRRTAARLLDLLAKPFVYGILKHGAKIAEWIRGDRHEAFRWYPVPKRFEHELSSPWRRKLALPVEILTILIGLPPLAILEGTAQRICPDLYNEGP